MHRSQRHDGGVLTRGVRGYDYDYRHIYISVIYCPAKFFSRLHNARLRKKPKKHQKTDSQSMNDTNIKPGFRFKDGYVSFCVTSKVPDKENMWNVRPSVPSSGFKRTSSNEMEMSTERIQKFADDSTATNVIRNMQTTSTAAGEISRKHSTRRTPFVFRTPNTGRLAMGA